MTTPATPRIDVSRYRKAVVAVVTAVTVIGAAVAEAVADGSLDVADGIQIATVVAGAFGVYRVANEV